jgi:hypothetical protein
VLVRVPEHQNTRLVAYYYDPVAEQKSHVAWLTASQLGTSARLAERRYILEQDVLATFVDKQEEALIYARSIARINQLRRLEERYQYIGLGKYALANAL